jgi:hypothetical protein
MEILSMIQYELKMELIRKENEEKIKKQKEKQDKIKHELEMNRKLEEEKKRQIERERQEASVKQENERKLRDQAKFMEEQKRMKLEQENEKKRLKELRVNQEEEKKKQEEYRKQIEFILEENMKKAEIKQKALEEKDMIRKEFLERKKIETSLMNEEKVRKKKMQIETNMKNLDDKINEQKNIYLEKQHMNDIKKQQFEELRNIAFKEKKSQAEKRSIEIKKVIQRNEEKSKNKIDQYHEKQKIIQIKKDELDLIKKEEIKAKLEKQHNRDEKIKKTIVINNELENAKKSQILRKIQIKEERLNQMNEMKERDLMEKSEISVRKKLEKEQNMRRISQMKEEEREKTLERLNEKSQRLDEFKLQKSLIADKKREIQEEINRKKQQYIEEFDKIFKKKSINTQTIKKLEQMFPDNVEVINMIHTLKSGDSNVSTNYQKNSTGFTYPKSRYETSAGMSKMKNNFQLATDSKINSYVNKTAVNNFKMPLIKDPLEKRNSETKSGVSSPVQEKPLKFPPLSDKEITKKLKELRFRLNNELLGILSEERQKEEERERIIASISNKTDRDKMEYNYGLERAKASSRIVHLNG